jgi:chromate transporter
MRYFFTLGSLGFGGPVALMNHMRRGLVEERHWLTEKEFDDGLAIAAICPGPIAFQLAIYCGYLRFGYLGGASVAFFFPLTPFLLVVTLAHFYQQFSSTWQLRAIFYGVSPVVVALIARACWHLGRKTLRRSVLQWALFLAAAALSLSALPKLELTAIFLTAGFIGALAFVPRPAPALTEPGSPARSPSPKGGGALLPAVAALPWSGTNAQIFAVFFKAGFFMFGSGLAVVPFLKRYIVEQFHWIDTRVFLDAVAVSMISPGPAAVAATFVSYLLNGFSGAAVATVAIFSPALLFTLVASPIVLRYRENARLQGFIQGIKVAVFGVLAGTTLLVARIAVGDLFTLSIALVSLVLLTVFKKIPEPLAVFAGALIGLAAYPWLQPAWVLK